MVILGEHTFPTSGAPAYRVRNALPDYDMCDATELWQVKDGYMLASWIELNCDLVWRKNESA